MSSVPHLSILFTLCVTDYLQNGIICRHNTGAQGYDGKGGVHIVYCCGAGRWWPRLGTTESCVLCESTCERIYWCQHKMKTDIVFSPWYCVLLISLCLRWRTACQCLCISLSACVWMFPTCALFSLGLLVDRCPQREALELTNKPWQPIQHGAENGSRARSPES